MNAGIESTINAALRVCVCAREPVREKLAFAQKKNTFAGEQEVLIIYPHVRTRTSLYLMYLCTTDTSNMFVRYVYMKIWLHNVL